MPSTWNPPANPTPPIIIANEFMTAVLTFRPHDGDRVDHFQVTSLTWHHRASGDYKYGTQIGRRIRADCRGGYSRGLSAFDDMRNRIVQVPEAQRTSTRVRTSYQVDPF